MKHQQLILDQRLTDNFSSSSAHAAQYVEQLVADPQQANTCIGYLIHHRLASSTASCLHTMNTGDASHATLLRQQLQQASEVAASEQQLQPLSQFAVDYLQEPLQALDDRFNYYVTDIWVKFADERSSKLPFMSAGPWKLLCATIIYLYLIKSALPRFMRNAKPLELNWLIRVYNLLMVFGNTYAFYHGCRIFKFGTSTLGCEIIDHKDYSPAAIELLYYGWLFFLSRIVEWLDTIFFVLRKKRRQVTKLHVFHHSFVPILVWVYLKFHPGKTVGFFPFINTFVHTIMYSYYFLASFGAKIQPYLWWKKYLTSLQIAQFVLIIVQLATIYASTNDKCQYPRMFLYVAIAGAILFLWLFYSYYVDTYSKSSQQHSMGATKDNAETDKSSLESDNNKVLNNNSCQKLNTLSKRREGHSSSLADAIENAIVAKEEEDDQTEDVFGHVVRRRQPKPVQ